MGQRGQLDKLPVAHTASVTALDWCSASTINSQSSGQDAGGLGWIVSGGLDRCVKVSIQHYCLLRSNKEIRFGI